MTFYLKIDPNRSASTPCTHVSMKKPKNLGLTKQGRGKHLTHSSNYTFELPNQILHRCHPVADATWRRSHLTPHPPLPASLYGPLLQELIRSTGWREESINACQHKGHRFHHQLSSGHTIFYELYWRTMVGVATSAVRIRTKESTPYMEISCQLSYRFIVNSGL